MMRVYGFDGDPVNDGVYGICTKGLHVSDSKKERKLTIFVEEDLHREVRIKGASLGLPFHKLVVLAMREWVNPHEKSAMEVPSKVAGGDAELVARLLRFWHAPEGVMGTHIRDLVAKVIGISPPE